MHRCRRYGPSLPAVLLSPVPVLRAWPSTQNSGGGGITAPARSSGSSESELHLQTDSGQAGTEQGGEELRADAAIPKTAVRVRPPASPPCTS